MPNFLEFGSFSHRGIFSEPLLVDNDLALDFLSLDFFIFKDNLLDLIPDEGPELGVRVFQKLDLFIVLAGLLIELLND